MEKFKTIKTILGSVKVSKIPFNVLVNKSNSEILDFIDSHSEQFVVCVYYDMRPDDIPDYGEVLLKHEYSRTIVGSSYFFNTSNYDQFICNLRDLLLSFGVNSYDSNICVYMPSETHPLNIECKIE